MAKQIVLSLPHVQCTIPLNNNIHTCPEKMLDERLISPWLSIIFFSFSVLRNLLFFCWEKRLFLHLVVFRYMSCRTEKTGSVLQKVLHYRNNSNEMINLVSTKGTTSRLKPQTRRCFNPMLETLIQRVSGTSIDKIVEDKTFKKVIKNYKISEVIWLYIWEINTNTCAHVAQNP